MTGLDLLANSAGDGLQPLLAPSLAGLGDGDDSDPRTRLVRSRPRPRSEGETASGRLEVYQGGNIPRA